VAQKADPMSHQLTEDLAMYDMMSVTATPPTLRKNEHTDSALSVILAYQQDEGHAEWCPRHKLSYGEDHSDTLSWSENTVHTSIRIKTDDTLPWRSSPYVVRKGFEMRTSVSEIAMDRVTVV